MRGKDWFRDLDSNQDTQLQRLMSYRLDDPGMAKRNCSRGMQACTDRAEGRVKAATRAEGREDQRRVRELSVSAKLLRPVHSGEVSERFKEHAWKACVGEILPWVQIPPSPPVFSFAKMLQDCARASQVAGGSAALFEVALVVVFGAIEPAGCGDFSGDGLTEFAAGLQRGL